MVGWGRISVDGAPVSPVDALGGPKLSPQQAVGGSVEGWDVCE